MRFYNKKEWKLLWPFYIDAIISPMLFFAPAFFIVYFQDLGFSLSQIGLIFAAPFLTSLVFEIPTGAVADIYGRKVSTLLGLFLSGIGFLSYFFVTNFYTAFLVSAFIGFATTFSTGANEAWVTDLINKRNKKLLPKYFAKSKSFDSFGLFISGILGAFIVKYFGLGSVWIIAGISFGLSIIILACADEEYKKRKAKTSESYNQIKKQTKEALSYSKKHPVLFYFLLTIVVFTFALYFSGLISWVPFLQDFGFPDYAFGYLWSAFAFIGVIAPLTTTNISGKKEEQRFLSRTIILWSLASVLAIVVGNLAFAILLALIVHFFDQRFKPIERVYFHRFVPTKLRATIGSVESMLLAIVGIIGAAASGFVVDAIGAQYTIVLAGFLALPAAFVLNKINNQA